MTAARIASTPLARKLARSAGDDLSRLRGSGPDGRLVAADLPSRKSSLRPDPLPQAGEGVRSVLLRPPLPLAGEGWGEGGCATTLPARPRRIASTPLARRIARTRNVGLARIRGSGPNGRIVARDMERSTVLTVEVATGAPAALCAHLNRTIATGAPPIAVADVVVKAVARVVGGDIAWTVDGIRPRWTVADAARQGLAAMARARTSGAVQGVANATMLRAVASGGRFTLMVAIPPGGTSLDSRALAARIQDTIAWPIGLLL